MKTVPYNTGRVLIGSNYVPPVKTWTPSRDQLTLQRALLKPAGSSGPGLVTRAVRAFWRWA